MNALDAWLISGFLAVGVSTTAMLTLSERAERRRLRRLRQRIEGQAHPMAVATLGGRVLWANAAMLRLCGANHARIESLLGTGLEDLDAAALFRMTRAARDIGFASHPLGPEGTAQRYLTLACGADDLLLWSVIGGDEIRRLQPATAGSAYEDAPFAHLRFGEGAPPACNARFRALFGSDPGPVLAGMPKWDRAEGDRVLLPGIHGTAGVFRAFLNAPDGSAERDLFLFAVTGTAFGRTGPAHVLEMVPVALAQFEMEGALVWCNSRARDILGSHATPGTRMADMFLPLGAPIEALLARLGDPEGEGREVGQMVQLRGTGRFVQIGLNRVRLYSRKTLLAVLTDASQFRQLQDQFAQSQKMEAVGKLAGGVAHDFNNVLTAILGHCDLLLLRREANHPDYADLMQIAQNANRAAALVRQLLAFSRKQTLNPETLSVRDVVAETHYLLDRLVGERVTLRLDFGTGLWPVRADYQQLEQVLMNLVVNARDAMAGNGEITVSVHNVEIEPATPGEAGRQPPGDYLEICVQDTGPGIRPDVIDRVFDPFFTTKPKGEGTGLGLSTVYGIVTQSGGFIFAENGPGGGGCFRIRLPRAEPEAVREGEVNDPAEPQVPPSRRRPAGPPRRDLTGSGSVLLVEDEDPVRAFAARALRLRGYTVAEAATAEAAMQILRDASTRIDLIVSDVVMPGMDGPTFAAMARRQRPGLRLIFISGYAEESFRDNLTETDFLFLPKPFTLNQLTVAVKEVLRGDAPAEGADLPSADPDRH